MVWPGTAAGRVLLVSTLLCPFRIKVPSFIAGSRPPFASFHCQGAPAWPLDTPHRDRASSPRAGHRGGPRESHSSAAPAAAECTHPHAAGPGHASRAVSTGRVRGGQGPMAVRGGRGQPRRRHVARSQPLSGTAAAHERHPGIPAHERQIAAIPPAAAAGPWRRAWGPAWQVPGHADFAAGSSSLSLTAPRRSQRQRPRRPQHRRPGRAFRASIAWRKRSSEDADQAGPGRPGAIRVGLSRLCSPRDRPAPRPHRRRHHRYAESRRQQLVAACS